jgi:hypothetical protein
MSIIKGKTNVVAGFGGTKRPLGEVYFSQSSLATDNPGALPGWTGEYYENGKTLFPDLYNFVKAHSELQVTKTQYDSAITTYGECSKYVVDEGVTSTKTIVKLQFPTLSYPIYAEQPEFSLDDFGVKIASGQGYKDVNLTEQCTELLVWHKNNNVYEVQATLSDRGLPVVSITTDENYQSTNIDYNYVVTSTETLIGSLRLPKYANYIKMANSTEGITQKGAGLPNITGSATTWSYKNELNPTGAFGQVLDRRSSFKASDAKLGSDLTFDASKSNAIYGAADTVQPAHTTLYAWISAYTSAIPASVAQAAEFTNALTGKANTDLSNVLANIDYVVESKVPTESDPSWYEVWKSGKVRQGGSKTTSGELGTQYTFLKSFANAAYTFIATPFFSFDRTLVITEKTATTFKVAFSSSGSGSYDWIAEGQGA